jgi:hypothetical protein
MAIGIGSIVAVKTSSVVVGSVLSPGRASPQPPCFGVNESAGSPYTVTWSNSGNRIVGIPSTSVDEITDATTPTVALIGQVVSIAGYSAEYNGIVVAAYARTGVDYVLLKSLSNGMFMEELASNVEAVAGL